MGLQQDQRESPYGADPHHTLDEGGKGLGPVRRPDVHVRELGHDPEVGIVGMGDHHGAASDGESGEDGPHQSAQAKRGQKRRDDGGGCDERDGRGALSGLEGRADDEGEESDNSGRVVVDLPNNQVGVDIKPQGQNLVIDLLKSSLPPNLSKKFDVTDFGTPVQKITATQSGDKVRLVIATRGEWEHSAYQSDNLTSSVRQTFSSPVS